MRLLLQILGVAASYFAAAKITLLFAIPPGYATPVWPAAGIALAALMRGGPRLWPAVFMGAAAVNFTIQNSLAAALAIGAGNTLEAVLGALIARRMFGAGNDPFARPAQIFQFMFAALGSAAVAASVGVGTLYALGTLDTTRVAINWVTWWLGDATGALIMGPLLLAWVGNTHVPAVVVGGAERAAYAALLTGACILLYLNWIPGARPLPLSFVVLPPLAWAALRFGEREVTTACALISSVAIWQASQGGGPFAALDAARAMLLLQAYVGTVTSISLALAIAMQALRRTANELRAAREEMEQFVDVAAHDMQEPLRNIRNFSDLLRLRHVAQLGREGAEYLDYVIHGARRLERVIDDLLAMARAGRGELQVAEVDSAASLSAALGNLRALIAEAQAVVTHDPLPRVHADPRLLESVFQNLVGNAIAFRGEAAPRVHVSARRAGSEWQFSVRDNGIGIDPEHFGVIFELFERLDPNRGGDNSGVGLAICRKVIERHGGRIWVESARLVGATFHFTLPSAEGDAHG